MGSDLRHEQTAAAQDRLPAQPTQPTELLPDELADALRFGEFHRALRLAIAHRGLSLARLQAHLRKRGITVGQSTLSYWQRGVRYPQVPAALGAVRTLESVLQLPPDALTVLIGRRRQRKEPRGQLEASFADLTPTAVGDQVDRLMDELSMGPEPRRTNANLEILSVHDTVAMDADQRQRYVATRIVLQASQSGADRYVAVYHGDIGCQIEDVRVIAAEGCRTGRIRRYAGEVGLAVELLFDRKLASGETHVFCFEIHDVSGGRSPGYHRMLRRRCPSYLLQLHFHERTLPARCVSEFRMRADVAPADPDELVCDIAGISSAFFRDVGPGLAGISVEWS